MPIHVTGIQQGGEIFPGLAATYTGNDWYSKPVWNALSREIEWTIHLEPPSGSPTSGKIVGVFEVWVSNYVPNNSQEVVANSKWVAITPPNQPDALPDGDLPTVIQNYNTAGAVLLTRRTRVNAPVRLHLTSSFAGGSSPGSALYVRHDWRA